MERKIGEIIEIEGKKYKCTKGETCAACAFDFRGIDDKHFCSKHAEVIGTCAGDFREDETRIIFIEVKE